jgi:hypothetical protein
MATEDLGSLIRAPGRLIVGATSFSAPPFYGGQQLGLVKDLLLRPRRSTIEIPAEEFGGEIVEEIDLRESWTMTCALRGLDGDALNAVFASTSIGASSGLRFVDFPAASNFYARLLSTTATGWLFVPDDVDRMYAVWFPAGYAYVDEEASIACQLHEEGVISVVVKGLRRASDNRQTQWGLLEDLTP